MSNLNACLLWAFNVNVFVPEQTFKTLVFQECKKATQTLQEELHEMTDQYRLTVHFIFYRPCSRYPNPQWGSKL